MTILRRCSSLALFKRRHGYQPSLSPSLCFSLSTSASLDERKKRLLERIEGQKLLEFDQLVSTHAGDCRIVAARCTNTAREAQRRWSLSPMAAKMWGEYMAGTVMYNSFFKGEERIKCELIGDGVVQDLYVETIQVGEARGFVSPTNVDVEVLNEERLRAAFQSGVMMVSKVLYGLAKPYATSLPACGVAREDWQRFYDQSEQVPSFVHTEAAVDPATGTVLFCGGLTVQAMPAADSSGSSRGKEEVEAVKTLFQSPEAPSLSITFAKEGIPTFLTRDLTPFTVDKDSLRTRPIDYHCRCSKDNFVRQLAQMEKEELGSLIEEGGASMTCNFCNETYDVTAGELKKLQIEAQP